MRLNLRVGWEATSGSQMERVMSPQNVCVPLEFSGRRSELNTITAVCSCSEYFTLSKAMMVYRKAEFN